ncbi:MAG: type III polyketide synthase [Cyclobacteriaceae bacterium]
MSTFIQHIGTAVPSNTITQRDVLQFMLMAHQLMGEEALRLKLLYRATGIKQRHSVLSDYGKTTDFEFFPDSESMEPFPDTKKRQEKYREEALALSITAVKDCLQDFDPKTITHVITVSCTGMYAPGLDIDLVQHLGLRPDVRRTAINFMGCYAAFNAIKVGEAFCSMPSLSNVLIVSTELCTLHFQKEPNSDNLLSNALFGDGSAAVLLTNRPKGKCLKLEHTYATLAPSGREEMAWDIGNHGFEMKLSSQVPEYLEKNLQELFSQISKHTQTEAYDYYALHPGGKRILQVLEKALEITTEQNRYSRDILRNYGNMSSATILFVLNLIFKEMEPESEGKKILALAFGPGLTLESMVMTMQHE